MEYEIRDSSLFAEGAQDEVRDVFERESETNRHIAHLYELYTCARTLEGKQHLGDYGMEHVRDEEDFGLASYFFVLSEMNDFSPEARDFFTDVMVHCEDMHGPTEGADVLREKYVQEIRPTL